MSLNINQPLLKILLVEDQEDDADLTKRALRKGGIHFECIRVEDKESLEKAIDEFKPNAILSDHALPRFNSIEALKVRTSKAPDTPFILVTGAVSDEFAAECIKRGADDYILKSNLSRLPAALKNALEHHGLERLRRQDEISLREQNERLVKVNKEIDSFVYSVSHNLRSPLSSILGLINIARHEYGSGKLDFERYMDMIEQSIFKLDDTIKEILEYSRNERTEIANQVIDMPGMINDCLGRIKYLVGFERVEKEISISGNFPFYSDPYRISIILSNLFSNAIKFRDENKEHSQLKITVVIKCDEVILDIFDNGIGIQPQNLPSVFNMFYRGSERSDGAGLGLYIVKEMVGKLGGTVAVESVPGVHTSVKIKLPNQFKPVAST